MKGWEEIRYQSPEEKHYTEEGEKVYKESIEAYKSPLEEKTSVKEFSPPMKDENLDIEKEIMMIDDNLRDMEKMFEEKKENVERKKEEIEEEILEQQTGKDVANPAGGGQTLEEFKSEQSKYEKFPTRPADTRRYILVYILWPDDQWWVRMFEHPMESNTRRIQQLSEEIRFRRKNGLPVAEL